MKNSPDLMAGAAFVDGGIVPISQAKISLLDWGFLHSDATYDVVHVWDGKFFRIDDHLQRFYAGMDRLRMSIPHTREEVKSILSLCVKASGLREAYVEMITTRGLPKMGSRDPRTCTNRFYAFAIPFVWVAKPNNGLNLIISQKQRIAAASVDPTIKNYHWLDFVMGQYDAYERGGENTLLVDAHGHIKEGPGFNVFVVKDNVLTTPKDGVLHGITRQTVMELADACGYKVIQEDCKPDLVRKADELFATSTAGGIIPVSKIDGQVIGDGSMGKITQELYDAYWKLHSNSQYTSEIAY